MKLTKLPNGSWINLATVSSIVPLPNSSSETGGTHRARVIIRHGEHGLEIITANDDEDALQLADFYAAEVNACAP